MKNIVCAWCKKWMGVKAGGTLDDPPTYGICPDCVVKERAKLEEDLKCLESTVSPQPTSFSPDM